VLHIFRLYTRRIFSNLGSLLKWGAHPPTKYPTRKEYAMRQFLLTLKTVKPLRNPAWAMFAVLTLSALSSAQLTTFHINSAPDTPISGTNVTDYDTYALPSSLMTGATISLHWNNIDSGSDSTGDCPSISFTTFDNDISTLVSDAESDGKFINFIVMPVAEGTSNSYTPEYVFTQKWANNLASSGTCTGITSPSWSSGESVLPGNYILVNSVYWQETATPGYAAGNANQFVGTCTTGTTEPAFLSTVSSYTDNTCTWTNVGSNAPPQDSCFSSYYTGNGVLSPGCYNVNSTTVTNLETGFLVSYETPMQVAWKNIIAEVISHYSAKLGSSLGYIRFGLSEGGESVPLTSQYWPYFKNPSGKGPSSGASIVYLSYINGMMVFQNDNQSTPAIVMQADLNAWDQITDYPDQEALYATENSIGIGTNGLQVEDVLQIDPPSGTCTSSNASISGDWCYNFQKYCSTKMPNGNYPICSLQTLQLSTPGNNNATVSGSANTGSLSNEYWDNSGTWQDFYGLIPTAKLYGANNLEIYTCDILYTTMYTYSTNNYPGTSSCTTNAQDNDYENDYYNTFAAALGQPGIYSPAPGGDIQTDSSVTLTWNPYPGAASYAFEIGAAQGGNSYFGPVNVGDVLTKSVTFSSSATTKTDVWVRWRAVNSTGGVLEQADYHFVAP
jgi:hypothetical protein